MTLLKGLDEARKKDRINKDKEVRPVNGQRGNIGGKTRPEIGASRAFRAFDIVADRSQPGRLAGINLLEASCASAFLVRD